MNGFNARLVMHGLVNTAGRATLVVLLFGWFHLVWVAFTAFCIYLVFSGATGISIPGSGHVVSITASMDVRVAEPAELAQLAKVWHDAWRDGHQGVVPPALTELRTLASFRERLAVLLPQVRVIGPVGSPLGFCIVRGDELYQLFVAAEARGTGIAARLVADAEARLRTAGVRTAWLACAMGNDRAARFYEKCGWRRAGTMVNQAEASSGTFALEVWRYEKSLVPQMPAPAR